MYRGRIVGIVPPDTSNEELGLLMAGSSAAAADGDAVPAPREPLDDASAPEEDQVAEQSSESVDE
jgi:general nucleoside transport system ATP-binding protein